MSNQSELLSKFMRVQTAKGTADEKKLWLLSEAGKSMCLHCQKIDTICEFKISPIQCQQCRTRGKTCSRTIAFQRDVIKGRLKLTDEAYDALLEEYSRGHQSSGGHVEPGQVADEEGKSNIEQLQLTPSPPPAPITRKRTRTTNARRHGTDYTAPISADKMHRNRSNDRPPSPLPVNAPAQFSVPYSVPNNIQANLGQSCDDYTFVDGGLPNSSLVGRDEVDHCSHRSYSVSVPHDQSHRMDHIVQSTGEKGSNAEPVNDISFLKRQIEDISTEIQYKHTRLDDDMCIRLDSIASKMGKLVKKSNHDEV
ncbi:hypothetical protein E1B28_009839 [Marasmius oreades]|uniref:Uncharacterized protein n=1 Tax=Marasmius oreades TaxID=181124 RepID=A0A9P7RVX7_9AGAR|nr:uncharacterized protein E1B28_009839 [Marasmius oreades]KAG7090749.1 hypothetical protein E1B28_009839 [Marasmius oreades]